MINENQDEQEVTRLKLFMNVHMACLINGKERSEEECKKLLQTSILVSKGILLYRRVYCVERFFVWDSLSKSQVCECSEERRHPPTKETPTLK